MFLAASALTAACAVAACGGASAAEHPPSTASPAAAQSTAAALSTPAARLPPATRSAATPAPIPRPRVSITRMRTADGALVTVATFLGPVGMSCTTAAQIPDLPRRGWCAPGQP